MLHHVRAEQVEVAQVVQPAIEREEGRHERDEEERALGGGRRAARLVDGGVAGAPEV